MNAWLKPCVFPFFFVGQNGCCLRIRGGLLPTTGSSDGASRCLVGPATVLSHQSGDLGLRLHLRSLDIHIPNLFDPSAWRMASLIRFCCGKYLRKDWCGLWKIGYDIRVDPEMVALPAGFLDRKLMLLRGKTTAVSGLSTWWIWGKRTEKVIETVQNQQKNTCLYVYYICIQLLSINPKWCFNFLHPANLENHPQWLSDFAGGLAHRRFLHRGMP